MKTEDEHFVILNELMSPNIEFGCMLITQKERHPDQC